MVDSDPRDAHRPVLQGIGAGSVAGLAVGLSSGLWGGVAASFGDDGTIAALPLSLALHGALGVLLGVLCGVAVGGLRAWTTDGSGLWRTLRDSPRADRKVAAVLLSLGVVAALQVVFLALFKLQVADAMARPSLAALSTGLFGAGSLLVAGLFLPALTRSFFVLLLPLRPFGGVPVSGWVLGAMLSVALGFGGYILSGIAWRVLKVGPWIHLALLVVVGSLLTSWFFRLRFFRWAWAIPMLLGIGLVVSAPGLGQHQGAVNAVQVSGGLGSVLIDVGRKLSDGDGDGFSRSFGGGDCDDTNSRINPLARDIPGNGIDENCRGGDAAVAPPEVRRPQPTLAGNRAAPSKKKVKKTNVLIVCVDTLRADVVGAIASSVLTPQIDRFAAGSTVFAKAYAQAANTPQSFPSVFTSRYPPRVPYKKRFTGYPVLLPKAVTIFEALQEAGWHTVGVSSHFYFKTKRGIRQGFDEWDNRGATGVKDSNKDIASPRIVPRAIEQLERLSRGKKPFAMFVHLFEPHGTYVKHRGKGYVYDKRGVAGLRQKYDNEVRFVDEWFGKLIDAVKSKGLDKNTVVALFSDHGEAFGEHRFYFHGQALYNEVLHVPLIVRFPGVTPGKVGATVGLLDLAPTLLEYLGLAAPPSFQGRSLMKAARGGELAPRPLGAALLRYPAFPKGQRAMIDGQYKVLWKTTENRYEIYDLSADPGERKNLLRLKPDLAKRLRTSFHQFVDRFL